MDKEPLLSPLIVIVPQIYEYKGEERSVLLFSTRNNVNIYCYLMVTVSKNKLSTCVALEKYICGRITNATRVDSLFFGTVTTK
jgi:hypothetical protein